MGTRRNPEAERKDTEAKAKKIVKMVALRDFHDSENNFHKAGEPCDVTQDEMERALVPHKLVTTPEAWNAKKAAEKAAAAANAKLEQFSRDDDPGDQADDDEGTTGEGKATKTATK